MNKDNKKSLFNTYNTNNNNSDFNINQELLDNLIKIRQNLEIITIHNSIQHTNENLHSQPLQPLQPSQYFQQYREFNIPNRSIFNTIRNIVNDYVDNINNIDINNFDDFDDLFEDVKVTLTENEFNNLNSFIEKFIPDNEKCTICLDNIKLNQELTQLKCKHKFHKTCIKYWLLNQSTKCPICRTELRN